MAEVSSTKQRSIPSGKFYFDALVNNVYTGERYMGLCPGGTITVKANSIQSYSAETGVRELDDETIIEILRTGSLVCRQISLANVGLFIIGDESTVTQAAAVGETDEFTVLKDRYYQLGASTTNPSGAQSVSNVVVKSSGGGITYDVDVDYSVDLTMGRVYIIAAGDIDDGDAIEVDYDVAAKTWDRLSSASLKSVTGSVRFIAVPMKGDVRDFYAPKCTLSPNGDLVLAQDDPKYAELTWDLSFAKGLDDEPALLINGRAV